MENRKIKIGIVQMQTGRDKQENMEKAGRMAAEAASQGAEIVCLPEMFACPMVHRYYREFAEKKGGYLYESLRDIAIRNKVFLIGGTVPEFAEDIADSASKIYNTSWTFAPDGSELHEYKKRRLFDISLRDGREFRESKTFASGESAPEAFYVLGEKMGLAICFELRFAEDFFALERSGARVVFVPANFSIPTGEVHWELLFRARALDNQFFVIGVSSARDPESKFMSYGHSIVADPWGEVLWQAGEGECVKVIEIDLGEIESRRAELPVVSARGL